VTTLLVTRAEELTEIAARLAGAPRVAFDLESNGLFVYRAGICMAQLATADEVVLVDTLATGAAPLVTLLGAEGPIKIVHDVSFDARLLAENGVSLGNVHDTSIAARMLGRTATGLASLLAAECGVTLDKALQHHDWGLRPLRAEHVAYLARDVTHLEALADKLWAELRQKGIEAEVDEETRYRLREAIAAANERDPEPAYARLKGIDRVPAIEQAILRRLVAVRDEAARRLDVPAYKVIGNEALFAIAHARPATRAALEKVRGATHGRAMAIAAGLLGAVATGLADGRPPEEDARWLERPRLPSAVAKARRAREARLMAWRKAEAQRRDVDPQVVLPGHCVKEIAEPDVMDEERLLGVGGFGACRAHYAGAIRIALTESAGPAREDERDEGPADDDA
jgi:ribonuclease D